jgi:hypothetical protein
MVLVGIMLLGIPYLKADDENRTVNHKFRTFTTNTSVGQGHTIFHITGVTTATNGVFGVYDVATYGAAATSNCAVEGGEATAGDALPLYDFGPEGLTLPNGMSVVVSNCYVTIEYL